MSASLPPESGIPPSGEPIPPVTIEMQLHDKRLDLCLQLEGIADVLNNARALEVDWHQIYHLLTRSQEIVCDALLLKRQVDQDDDDDLSDTPLVPEAGHASTDPDDSPDVILEGGDA